MLRGFLLFFFVSGGADPVEMKPIKKDGRKEEGGGETVLLRFSLFPCLDCHLVLFMRVPSRCRKRVLF